VHLVGIKKVYDVTKNAWNKKNFQITTFCLLLSLSKDKPSTVPVT